MIAKRRAVVRFIDEAELNNRFVRLFKLQQRFQFLDALLGQIRVVVKRVRRIKAVSLGETAVAVANDVAFET
jgi:2-phospho-L-lactate guanylyltransferase (CobY/MobA/RfbA family)